MSARAVSIASIVGACPQFMKAAMVSRVLGALGDAGVRDTLIHTGQHCSDNMWRVFFEELDIPEPGVNRGVGAGGPAGHGAQIGRMLEGIEECLIEMKPDWVVVYGDTNSTLAGALAAAKVHIPVAHVEAGLRSFNCRMPGEINRVVTDHLSDLLFVPTHAGAGNLRREVIPEERIWLVGDVMYDAALCYGERAGNRRGVLRRLGLSPRGYVPGTVHRAENTDDPAALRGIFEGLARASREVPVLLPLHPLTEARLAELGLLDRYAGAVRLIDPVGYLVMLMVEKHARLIVTDSGGVQKEAFFCSVPCVTLRGETEWTELVESGWNHLAPPHSADEVVEGILQSLDQRGAPVKPYGSGNASERITRVLVSSLRAQDNT